MKKALVTLLASIAICCLGCRTANHFQTSSVPATITNDPRVVQRCQFVGDVATIGAWNRVSDPAASQQAVEDALRQRAGKIGANTVYVAQGSTSGAGYHCPPSSQR
jgi:hypothetical protein